ncbi:MAG: hypothetical protein V5A22_11895 [Salinivenus sp.]
MSLRFFPVAALLAVLLTGPAAQAQTDGLLTLDDETHRFLESQRAKGHLPDAFLTHRPLSVYEARRYLDSLALRDSAASVLTPANRQQLARLRGETARPGADWARRVFSLYENGQDLVSIEGDGYAFQLNPRYYGHLGPTAHEEASGRFANDMAWRNTRGLRFSGHVGDYFFFESRLSENQWRPVWPAFSNNTAPRVGHISFYDDGDPYNYFEATGIVGLRTRHVEVRLGRGRTHWGPGQGSVFFSDYGTVHDQAQIRATLGPLQYSYLLARFLDTETQAVASGPRRPSRYGVFHHLTLHATDALTFDLYEGVIMGRDTTAGGSNFDPAYLNPAVVFRPVERDLGSGGNALLGVGGEWRPLSGAALYGQFVLDELRVSEIGNQWWANKWGWLLGLHVAEPGVPHLSARLEAARLRPYLYSHRTSASAFTHMGDLVGHPAGPNSVDLSLFLDYEPPGPWRALLNASWTVRGRNAVGADGTTTANYGGDATAPSRTRVRRYGVSLLQGIRQRHGVLDAALAYEVLPHLRVTAAVRAERLVDDERGTDYYLSPRLLLSWGLPFQQLRY